MDISKAALVTLLVFVFTEVVKQQWPNVWLRFKLLIVFPLGEGATFLVSYTVWAHDNVIGGKPLDQLDVPSKIVGGLLISAAAVGFNVVVGAVMNVGQNQVPSVSKPLPGTVPGATPQQTGPLPPVPPAPAAAPEVPAPITPTS